MVVLRALNRVVDVMRVPVDGDPARAVIDVGPLDGAAEVSCGVLVVGGGSGGTAAALAALRAGCRVVLTEETDWLGGQFTSQGVSALDEHDHIEAFGGTARYYDLRRRLRDHYRSTAGEAGRQPDFNPGNCWVSRLAFEPRVAAQVLTQMLEPHADRLTILYRCKPVAAEVVADRIERMTVMGLDDRRLHTIAASMVIDATELGDLLPLTGAEHVVGAETVAQTCEPQAQPVEAKRHCVQSFTYTFACERRPEGEQHVVAPPDRYAHDRDTQPFSLRIEVHGGEIYGETSGWLDYRLFDTMPGTKGGLWTYRRLLDRGSFATGVPHDVAMFNWPGNDYRDRSLLDGDEVEVARALQEAKRVSLGFLHWLQTEAPATTARRGAPELRLRPDVMGSVDGLSKHPYIRESRRIRALKTIVEQEVSAHHQPGLRAAHFADSVGVGWYPIDIHRSGPDDVGASCRTRPFQIPLGSLIPVRLVNLLAGGKNLGSTHITNGCYRLHPVEWNVGEAAGALAAFSLTRGVTPADVWQRPELLASFQRRLLAEGLPLAWLIDIRFDDPRFVGAQKMFMLAPHRFAADLRFNPEEPLSSADAAMFGFDSLQQLPVNLGEAALLLSSKPRISGAA